MKGGTYARALNKGFTQEQAGFLGLFGAEIKDEASERVHRELAERAAKAPWLARVLRKLADMVDNHNEQ